MSGYADDRFDEGDDRRDRGEGDRERPRRSDAADLARSKVAIPAMLLILNGLLGLAFATFLFVITVAAPDIMLDWLKQVVANQPAGPEKQQNEQKLQDLENQLKQDRAASAITTGIELGVFALLNLVAIYGAVRMKSLGSSGWGMASAIVSLIPCTTGCCCTGPILGIWALLVLMNPDVKAGFQAARTTRASPDGY